MGRDTKVEIAGWLDRAPVCGLLAQAILSKRVLLSPAMDWSAWACEFDLRIVIGGIHEELMGPLDAHVV